MMNNTEELYISSITVAYMYVLLGHHRTSLVAIQRCLLLLDKSRSGTIQNRN